MKYYELVAPCHMGLEAVLKREIIDLGYDITEVADGRVSFQGDADAVSAYRGEYMSSYSWASITESFMDYRLKE